MYQYNTDDQRLVDSRVAEFRQQTTRFLDGRLSADQFRPLRLMNGLYVERQAPMLRVAIPYGELCAQQLRKLAHIARSYDRGYGHITTRQNIQFNWPSIENTPRILAELATVQMHAIQSSGNCVRNITADHLAGITSDEVADPRPYCELIRQWTTLHPEFAYLPRKFKIAVTGAPSDRAASQVHDIGLHLVRNEDGDLGFEVLVGGGLGRTPVIGKRLREFLPVGQILAYLEAILRAYNLLGRRDNKYKARIKILVGSIGLDQFRALVEEEWQANDNSSLYVDQSRTEEMAAFFRTPGLRRDVPGDSLPEQQQSRSPEFTSWLRHNTITGKHAGYRAVYVSLKAYGMAPGDITESQMDALADIADAHAYGQLRTTHTQNILLPYVAEDRLFPVWQALSREELATPNISTLTDIICCPGFEFCSLANATSIPIAKAIQDRFRDLDELYSLGDIQIKISGCMNACGHHHVGHIGILGVDKKGEEWYQLTLGGAADEDARLGKRLGPAVAKADIADAVERIVRTYLALRFDDEESFLATFRRVDLDPFKEAVYG